MCLFTTSTIFICMGKSVDITNHKFGNLIALQYSHTNKVEYWDFKCLLCEKTFTTRKPDVVRGKTKSCGCKKNVGENNGNWNGYESINGRTISHYKKIAKKRGIEFNITIEDLWRKYVEQEMKCPYTGISLIISPKNKILRTPNNASLDRIDSNLGYIVSNIQWVYKKVNVMKNTMTHDEFIDICNLISKNCSNSIIQ